MSAEIKATTSFWADIWDIGKIIVEALAIALVVRIFLFQPFNIPSSSMENTLLVGDYIFVSKYSYGYSKYSMLFDWPSFSGRILEGTPKRGDVAVFRKPADTSIDYIKRVVGIPGDVVKMDDGVLSVNGKALPKNAVEPFKKDAESIPRFEEINPDNVHYFVLDADPNGNLDTTQAFKVPPGHYFMMGDNRDNSSDSRDPGGGVGFVPIENFVGRAQIIFFSHDQGFQPLQPWAWPWHIRWERFGKLVY
jgi:signal peptidase I